MTRPACHKTKNRAFFSPQSAPQNAVRAAIKTCKACPIRKKCAAEALTAGTSLSEDHRAPASDVIQAGVICRGDWETATALATIAGVPIPDFLVEKRRRNNYGAHRPDHCRSCEQPMVKWNRNEQQPEGFVVHYARGFCQNCRSAYRDFMKEHPEERRGLRKPIDRKNHTAPPKKAGVVVVQPSLFDLENVA